MRFLLLLLLTLIAPTLSADAWKGEAKAEFFGTSTLHDWSGHVPLKPFKAEVTLTDGHPSRIQAQLEAGVVEMDTENEGRDEKMHKAMRAEEHPLIIGNADWRIPRDLVHEGPGKVPIALTLLGGKRTVEATVTGWKRTEAGLEFDCEFSLSLKENGIEIPSFLLFIKVGDEIRVKTRVSMRRS